MVNWGEYVVGGVSFPEVFYTSVNWQNLLESGPFEDVFPSENGDIPASYVSFPESRWNQKDFYHFVNGLNNWTTRQGLRWMPPSLGRVLPQYITLKGLKQTDLFYPPEQWK